MTQPTKSFQLPLDAVGIGMSLAEPLMGAQGEVVLSQGVELTQALLQALRRRGVTSLSVLVPDEGLAPAPAGDKRSSAAELQLAQLERLAQLFRNDDGQSGTARLRALVTRYRLDGSP